MSGFWRNRPGIGAIFYCFENENNNSPESKFQALTRIFDT